MAACVAEKFLPITAAAEAPRYAGLHLVEPGLAFSH